MDVGANRPAAEWTSVPADPAADPDHAVPSHAADNVNNLGWISDKPEALVKDDGAWRRTVPMAISVSGAVVAVCWLLYVALQHASSAGAHGPHRNSSSSLRNSSSSLRTPVVLKKFPKGMPDYCRLDHLDAPRLLHMGISPAVSSKALTVARASNGSVSLKTSRGFYLVVDNQTRNILLQKNMIDKKRSRKDVGIGCHFKVLHHGKCHVTLRTSSGYFVSGLGDGMLDITSSEELGVRESFDAFINENGTVALRMWDGSYLDAEQLVYREHRYAVLLRETPNPKTSIRVVRHGNREVSLASRYGTYLSAGPNGVVTANSTSVGQSERFTTLKVSDDVHLIAFRTSFGKYLQIKNGRVVATSGNLSDCAIFVSSDNSSAYTSFKSCHRYISVERVPIYTFLGYRALPPDDEFEFKNVNIGNLAGVMWYLHNEVVAVRPRKFGISRIVRAQFRVTAPNELLPIGMHFGVRFAYDSGMCTGAGPEEMQGNGSCDPFYKKYGFFVGCNNLNSYPFPMASQGFPTHYPGARWYSLPGQSCCGEGDIVPTGEPECIYSYKLAGDINISELEGIEDYDAFVSQGGQEYVLSTDVGESCGFWDRKFDTAACDGRLKAARRMFAKKHPDLTQELRDEEPPCDFDCYRFYDGDPYDPPDDCNETIQAEIAARTHPMSAPSWTWDYGMNVSDV